MRERKARPSSACTACRRGGRHLSTRPGERAALEWAETLTLIASHHVSDELYTRTREHFTEAELVGLTVAVVAINGWNRFNIAFQTPAGDYQPGSLAGFTTEVSHA